MYSSIKLIKHSSSSKAVLFPKTKNINKTPFNSFLKNTFSTSHASNITNRNKTNKDTTNQNTKLNKQSDSLSVSSLKEDSSFLINKEETNCQMETSLNTYIKMLSPQANETKQFKPYSQNKKSCIINTNKNKGIIHKSKSDVVIREELISNPYISPVIKYKMNSIFNENIVFNKRLINKKGIVSKYKQDIELTRRLSLVDNNYGINNNNNKGMYWNNKFGIGPLSSRNNVEEMQSILNKFFYKEKGNDNNNKYILSSIGSYKESKLSVGKKNNNCCYSNCKRLNKIKKKEEELEIDLFKNQFTQPKTIFAKNNKNNYNYNINQCMFSYSNNKEITSI